MDVSANSHSVTYHFPRSSAFKAAKLAYKVELARQEEFNHRDNKLKALRVGLRAFRHRTVCVPEFIASKTSQKRLLEIKHLVINYSRKRVCARQLTPYELPENFRWSIGRAKNASRHIVVRNWVDPRYEGSSMHSSLSIKDTDSGVHDYVSIVPGSTDPTVNSTNLLLKGFFTLAKLLKRSPADNIEAYSKDKFLYIAPRTRAKLVLAERDIEERKALDREEALKKRPLNQIKKYLGDAYLELRSAPKVNFASIKMVAKPLLRNLLSIPQRMNNTSESTITATIRPFATQKKNRKTGKWERRAQKVYLPCQGFDHQERNARSSYTMFGLNFSKMRRFWAEFKSPDNPDYFYRRLSRYNNCSGAALRLLKEGGCDTYIPIRPKLYTDQKLIDQYSYRLVLKLDKLNKTSDALLEKLNSKDVPKISSSEAATRMRSESSLMPNKKIRKSLFRLANLAEKISEVDIMTESLTPLAIQYVEALRHAYKIIGDTPKTSQLLDPALSVFSILRKRMMQATQN